MYGGSWRTDRTLRSQRLELRRRILRQTLTMSEHALRLIFSVTVGFAIGRAMVFLMVWLIKPQTNAQWALVAIYGIVIAVAVMQLTPFGLRL